MQNSAKAYRVHPFCCLWVAPSPSADLLTKSKFKSSNASRCFQTIHFYDSVVIFLNIGTANCTVDGEFSVLTRKTNNFVNGNADDEGK